MKGRNLEAGHTTAPDHMPKRTKNCACIKRGVHTRPHTSGLTAFMMYFSKVADHRRG